MSSDQARKNGRLEVGKRGVNKHTTAGKKTGAGKGWVAKIPREVYNGNG